MNTAKAMSQLRRRVCCALLFAAFAPCALAAAAETPAAGTPAAPAHSRRALDDADVVWLERARTRGRELLQRYAQTTQATPAELDRAFRNWKADRSARRAEDDAIAQGLGALFGDYVAAQRDGRWMVVQDRFGSDLAVVFGADVETYPINSVLKRIDPANDDIAVFDPIWTALQLRYPR